MPDSAGWSLRSRLLVMLVALTTALFTLSVLQNWHTNREASNRLFDDSLKESAGLLLQLAQHEISEHGRVLGIELLKAETQPGPYGFRFQIWSPDMRGGYHSEQLPTTPLLPFEVDGFGWTEINGARWRAYSTWNREHTVQIQIAQALSGRQALDRWALLQGAAGAMLLLLAACALIWAVLSASMRPLQRTADSVGERSEQDLRSVEAVEAPREVMPLIAALNRLLDRIRTAMERERRFTADAAHELRTPLAAIRANAQVLVGARDAAERDATAADLLASVDRATRMVEQLLALARADRPLASDQLRDLDLADIAREQLALHRQLAVQHGVQLSGALQPAPLRGDPALLSVLVRNLLDNAMRYTQPGGSVQLLTANDEASALLQVQDNGPGIPESEREQVFDRFHRIAGAASTGSGLGLSIVRRVAEVHGARVEISTGDNSVGTRVSVRFGQSSD